MSEMNVNGCKKLGMIGVLFLIFFIVVSPVLMNDVRLEDSKLYRIGFDARTEENYENNMIFSVYNETGLIESVLTWRSAFQEKTQDYQYYNMLEGHWNFSTILTFRYIWFHNETGEVLLYFTLINHDWIDVQGYGSYFYYFEASSCLFITEYFVVFRTR